jgi:hypothetical protein
MFVYLIILLIYFNCIVSQLSNNESLLVFSYYNSKTSRKGIFTAKFGKTLNQINESHSHLLAESHYWVEEIGYSLSANVILWREDETFSICPIYAIPIDNR